MAAGAVDQRVDDQRRPLVRDQLERLARFAVLVEDDGYLATDRLRFLVELSIEPPAAELGLIEAPGG